MIDLYQIANEIRILLEERRKEILSVAQEKDIPKNAIGLSLPSYENDKELKTVFIIFEDKTYKEFGKYH